MSLDCVSKTDGVLIVGQKVAVAHGSPKVLSAR